MFKKLLSGIGIGAASIDLEIPQPRVEVGGTISGTVRYAGGAVDQEVEQIYLILILDSRFKHDDHDKSIREEIIQYKIYDRMVIPVNAPEVSFPVRIPIPYDIPISRGRTKYHFMTGLDVKSAVDPKDLDEVVILPNAYMKTFFDALQLLGFREKPFSGDYNGRVQQFEYKPTRFMAGKLDELEICLAVSESKLNVFMQIDKKAKGLWGKIADDMDLDERHVGFTFSYAQLQNVNEVASILKKIIEEEYSKINC